MKKKTLIIVLAIVAVVAILAVGVLVLQKMRAVSINASFEQAVQQLTDAGYTVNVVTDTEELAEYGAQGMTAAVIAYKGAEKLDAPDEEKLENYGMVELFYFETEDQAEAYYRTDEFQLGYQAWSDAYYHIGISDFNYSFTGNIAFAGIKDAIGLCK